MEKIIFWTLNKRTKKVKSEITGYEYVSRISTEAKNTIILNVKGENIHPSLWNCEWFEDEWEACEYIRSVK